MTVNEQTTLEMLISYWPTILISAVCICCILFLIVQAQYKKGGFTLSEMGISEWVAIIGAALAAILAFVTFAAIRRKQSAQAAVDTLNTEYNDDKKKTDTQISTEQGRREAAWREAEGAQKEADQALADAEAARSASNAAASEADEQIAVSDTLRTRADAIRDERERLERDLAEQETGDIPTDPGSGQTINDSRDTLDTDSI